MKVRRFGLWSITTLRSVCSLLVPPPTITPVLVPRSKILIDYNTPITFLGSCFGEKVHSKLGYLKFPRLSSNPQGIAFNPISIAESLSHSLEGRVWGENDLQTANGKRFSFAHHSSFTRLDTDSVSAMLAEMNKATRETKMNMELGPGFIFITLGTARVYVEKITGRIVANNHRQPEQHFDRKMLTVAECVAGLNGAIEKAKLANHQVVVTVSPVRHTRDGMAVSSLSKATLRLACAELESLHPHVTYFPAFEIVLDELRDYRYYNPDMIHPNDQAVQIIFSRFAQTYLDKTAVERAEKITQLQADFSHRASPHLEKSVEYLNHCRRTLERMQSMSDIDWTEEISALTGRIG
jgi:GSCFA family